MDLSSSVINLVILILIFDNQTGNAQYMEMPVVPGGGTPRF
jgi:hypothetical protein